MASSKETYCLCGQPYNIGQFMIECDCCREWFHGSCVDIKIFQSDDIDKYHCPKCAQTYGPSVLKVPTNNHRADRYELGAESRPSQVGTPAWVRALAARPLRPSPHATQRMRPQHFTEELVRDNGFTKPVMFTTSEGLEMKIPNPASFTVRSVLRYCGASLDIEVIDVRKQATVRLTLGEFVDYIETPIEQRDDRVLNVLSLEFTDTNMAALVEAPGVLRRLDWAAVAWPTGERARPAVQKYCLVSAAASYTDFHVDFGGTTVWYHVLHGRKIFYLIPPTSTNLALYQQWCASNNQNERFFGDMVEWYGTAELTAGQTLFIPSGWIHAVLTPCDSLVFGGNLLHSYAIEMQLQIYEIERRVETPTMFRYPLFEAMHWYAGAHLLIMLRRHNEETQDEDFIISESCVQSPPAQLPPLLLRGIKILSNALKEWHALKSTDASKRDNVPKCLNSGQLVRELCKELRTLEKRSSSAANKDKDFKIRNNTSPNKHAKKQQSSAKKSLKLTLPKPIMHMTPNGEFEEKVYADKFYIDNKEVIFQERYVQSVDYANGLPDAKYIVDGKEVVLPEKYAYQTYEEVPYADGNGYVEKIDKKSVLKIKMSSECEMNSRSNSPSSSREEAPPPYPLPEHSILKSHLIRSEPATLKPIHQWTISKKDIGDYQEEQILFTNEHLQANVRIEGQDLNYGPGMYSAEDVQQDYQYSEAAKPGSYQPEYGYRPQQQLSYTVNNYQRYVDVPTATVHQEANFANVPVQEPMNGAYHPNQLPSYDAAIAQQYATNNYQSSTAATASPSAGALPVRRSERPVRRRVSTTYDYEDCDLYIDDAPAPRRRKPPKHRAAQAHAQAASSNTNSSGTASTTYRQPPNRPAPTNGIESLIQASVLAEEEQTADAPCVPGRTVSEEAVSDAVCDAVSDADADAAVAGMLSISSRFTPHATFGLAHAGRTDTTDTTHRTDRTDRTHADQHFSSSTASSSKRSRKPTAAVEQSSADEEFVDEQDVIKEVHRDDEYVYPSLDMSSDEDDDWSVSRRRRNARKIDKSKSEKDESWCPRARLGRLVPRLRGPARGVRRECVRAALCAAANRHNKHHAPHAPHAQHAPHAHATHATHAQHATTQNAKRAVLATKSRRPPPPVHNTPNNKNSRLKKGMKTAKQRLGKILKIHKMIY